MWTKHTLVITSDSMGRGSDELGARLIVKFFHQLAHQATRPETILFYNAGVRLLTPESPVLEAVRTLEHDGVELLACGTCVEYYQLVGRIAAGRVTDMGEIVARLGAAERTVTI